MIEGCTNNDDADWRNYGGNKAGNRYSTLKQINKENVKDLKIAWTYDTAEDSTRNKIGRNIEIQCQPIVVNDILYGTTPMLKLFALEAATGKELWKFDPFKNKDPELHPSRGVTYWEDQGEKRILYTAGSGLYAINAITGDLIKEFGNEGIVDLHEGLSHDSLGHDVLNLSVRATSPGIIYKNIFIIGSTVSERGDAAPGYIRGFDVKTGKLVWVFHTIPLPGEPGYETWQKDSYKKIGGANCWAGMVLDEKRGAVYFGTGSPSSDFYGGERAGKNLFANCILSLEASTGKLNWYFQTIYHDLWDRDMACPPNLVTVKHKGRSVDVVVQATKDGLIYVLDRDKGTSLFPVEERSVPTQGLPGEKPWPTQKFPLKPAPLSRQVLTIDDITNISPESNAFVKQRFTNTRSGDKFMPPSIEGTLFYAIGGGAEWGGNSIDPSGILYQNVNEMVWDVSMTDLQTLNNERISQGKKLYLTNCASCHGVNRKGASQEYPSLINVREKLNSQQIHTIIKNGSGRMPSFQHIRERDRNALVDFLSDKESNLKTKAEVKHSGKQSEAGSGADSEILPVFDSNRVDNSESVFPYNPPYNLKNGLNRFLDPDGYPAIKPPWGTLNAVDLNTGEYLWTVLLGEFPELTKKGIPVTGTENYGGPIVTAGGLVFIAGTKDERIRAFDKQTGKIVWEFQLPAGGFATPITYQSGGKQYIVIAAGGVKNDHKPGGKYIAFALP
ncbi:outer membrane protein assembly factor BamB family protein [Flavitalea sp.]|nr:PQQ-binding-like beta-propeller repeat protein [Flavitalea sp.]